MGCGSVEANGNRLSRRPRRPVRQDGCGRDEPQTRPAVNGDLLTGRGERRDHYHAAQKVPGDGHCHAGPLEREVMGMEGEGEALTNADASTPLGAGDDQRFHLFGRDLHPLTGHRDHPNGQQIGHPQKGRDGDRPGPRDHICRCAELSDTPSEQDAKTVTQ